MRESENHIIMDFHIDLYDREVLYEAGEEFKKLCGLRIQERDEGIISAVIDKGEDARTVVWEFANYVLSLMKEKGIF